MQRKARGVLREGSIYDPQFDGASGENIDVKKGAELTDTLALLPDYVPQYAFQAKRITGVLCDMDGDVFKTCQNIWKFLYYFIGYKPDEKGKEQIRSVWRLWQDKIGDCDCFAFFISCVLYNLHINHTFRITKYTEKGGFQHIYVVVPHKGKEIIIDGCLESFNSEAPDYIEKIEVKMDLQFLNGFDSEEIARNGGSIDAQDLLFSSLGKGKVKDFFHKEGDKIKTAANKSVHAINTVNPATAALRLGLLSAMKLNLLGVSEKLRYAYLSDDEAQKRGLNMKRFARYKRTREKLEKIFFSAGGKPENLRQAILTGKGNGNKEVPLSGLGESYNSYSENSALKEILGEEMFADETAQSLEGLGVVVTATAVSAASGILAIIAGILKNIGDLKKSGEPGSDAALDKMPDDSGAKPDDSDTTDDSANDNSGDDSSTAPAPTDDESKDNSPTEKVKAPDGSPPPADNPNPDTGAKDWKTWLSDFYTKNKTTIWVAGGTIAAVGTILLVRHFTKKENPKRQRSERMDGAPKQKGKNKYAGSETLRKLRMSPLR